MLTRIDRQLILRQCELQSATSPEEVAAFTTAYRYGKDFAENEKLGLLTTDGVLKLMHELLRLTVPETGGRFRIVPATFTNLSIAVGDELINRTILNLAEAFAENRISPELFYREFEEIHPGEDGNGRVGDVLWKISMTRETGEWPETLPPDLFRPGAEKPKYESVFGEVES